jgi:plastocyanin
MGSLRVVFLVLCALTAVHAADIRGTVVIKHRLTKRKVTAQASPYQRGVAVELGSEEPEDLLIFERTRVVVYPDGDFPSQPVVAAIEQKNRRFVPDTLVVPLGSTVSFPNLDTIFHNVFSLSKPKTFDLGNYPKDQTRTVTFARPGIVFVHCRLHPNMAAAIVVSPNQWSTKADSTGRFSLAGVPPGRHTLVAWHKAAGFFQQTVQVTEDGAGDVQFIIPLDEDGINRAVAQR